MPECAAVTDVAIDHAADDAFPCSCELLEPTTVPFAAVETPFDAPASMSAAVSGE